MSKNIYEKFAEHIAADPGYVARAGAQPPDFADFSWLAGDWTWEMRIHATASTPARVVTSAFKYVAKKASIWAVSAQNDPAPYYTYDPFNGLWVLSLANPTSYGTMTSPGWRDGVIQFDGTMTFMGIEMRLRQRIQKLSNDELLTKNDEWVDDAWVPVDEISTRRR